MALGSNNELNSYNKFYLQFRRGAKEDTPYFSIRTGAGVDSKTNKVSGVFSGIFHNDETQKMKKDGTPFTAKENFVIVLVDGNDQYNIQIDTGSGTQLRAVLNSLLSANIGDSIEFNTYTSKSGRKAIAVANSNKKKEIVYKDKTISVPATYDWAYSMSDVPPVEYTENKKGELVDVDDSLANEFFFSKIKDKFAGTSNTAGASDDIVDIEDLPF